jgi:hypothetical protein
MKDAARQDTPIRRNPIPSQFISRTSMKNSEGKENWKMLSASMMLGIVFFSLTNITPVKAQNREEYERTIANIPRPNNSEEHEITCQEIRIEIARQRGAGEGSRHIFSGQKAIDFEIAWRRNVALLESKATEFNCSAPFAESDERKLLPEKSSIEQCIVACKEHTNRSGEQCFDSCNK